MKILFKYILCLLEKMALKFHRILFTNILCYFKWINVYIKQATRDSNVIFEIFLSVFVCRSKPITLKYTFSDIVVFEIPQMFFEIIVHLYLKCKKYVKPFKGFNLLKLLQKI